MSEVAERTSAARLLGLKPRPLFGPSAARFAPPKVCLGSGVPETRPPGFKVRPPGFAVHALVICSLTGFAMAGPSNHLAQAVANIQFS